MNVAPVQYISDTNGKTTGVIVPIELWREISAADETDYLLSSPTMRRRLLAALKRDDGIPFNVTD